MEHLLPHYERELAWLRKSSQQFAQAYPRIAGKLQLAHDVSQDPHVERMIESFALLAARVHKRLDDDFPLFTETLLEVLYPHYLRPFPSCSVACFELGPQAAQMTRPLDIERGTALTSRPVKGVTCKFLSTQPLRLWPLKISQASYRNAVVAPAGTRLPAGATSVLSITLDLLSPQARWQMLEGQVLRVYLDGEASQVSALREVLAHKVVGVMTQWHPHHPWVAADAAQVSAPGAAQRQPSLPRLAGFADDEALLDMDARSHPAYRLLTEYFAFPEKFNFIDLPVPLPPAHAAVGGLGGLGGMAGAGGLGAAGADADQGAGPRQISLQLLVAGVRADSDESRLLETMHAGSLVLGCTPVINLMRQPADPIRITHTAVSYPVLVDARRAWGHEVVSIDRVFRVKQTPQGEAIEEFRPFFSLKHDDMLATQQGGAGAGSGPALGHEGLALGAAAGGDTPGTMPRGGRYWHATRDETLAEHSPGFETELSLVDVGFNPALPQTDTLSLTVTATNRDLPTLLPFSAVGGDLFLEGGSPAREIRLLRKPTPTQRFKRGKDTLWRLISHLSLNHLSLSGGGLDALKEMLLLYDLPRSPANARQVEGLVAIDYLPCTAWLPGEPFATFVRGTEVRLTVDEASFVGTGLGLFAAVLDHFFALYVHANSFTQLKLVSARTQELLLSCPPRNGAMPLV